MGQHLVTHDPSTHSLLWSEDRKPSIAVAPIGVHVDDNVKICVKPRLHDTTGCQTGCQTGLTTGLTTGCNNVIYKLTCQ